MKSNDGAGRCPPTVTVELVAVVPPAPTTLSVIVYVPGVLNTCVVVAPDPVAASPNDHSKLVAPALDEASKPTIPRRPGSKART